MSDPSSYANHAAVRVASFHLDATVDFERSVLAGYVDLTLERVGAAGKEAGEVVLDTRGLKISSVVDAGTSSALEFSLGAEHEVLGAPLHVRLPAGDSLPVVRVAYETSPSASALQWLPPAQTAGKKHPYLFSQCQAIHARSMLPCQDSPGNKTPYTASLRVPSPLVALMSALSDGHKEVSPSVTEYRFRQPVPMSAYLVAIAVGKLESRELGPRSRVWSEAEMVDRGAHEFADTEKFIAAAEEVAGPYVWGRYDVLLLPPSFPYGGMENPCLTFVTPTLLAGDRSLANVVAHEIAHSWSGNLVSPATWEHFWLNEGFTVFLERKIVRAVFGPLEQHLHAQLGLNALEESIEQFGAQHPYTVLNVKLEGGVDPDDAFSSVPYEKGFNLLWYLEQLVGGDESLNPFLRAHFEKWKYGATTTEEWRQFFVEYHRQHGTPDSVLDQIDWQAWLHGPGALPVRPTFNRKLIEAAVSLAEGMYSGAVQPEAANMQGWSSNQVVVFLERLRSLEQAEFGSLASSGAEALAAKKAERAALFRRLDAQAQLTNSGNSEIRHRWYQVAIRAEMADVMPAAARFLTEQGRMKFTRTLYRDLFASAGGRQLALDTFKAHRQTYHLICSKMVAKDLGVA